ncbi:MAG: hypothetical protein HYZ53_05210 [Planctomycetes bacterium]|nr:hypothetical protein [Planctomycetota bacterium]
MLSVLLRGTLIAQLLLTLCLGLAHGPHRSAVEPEHGCADGNHAHPSPAGSGEDPGLPCSACAWSAQFGHDEPLPPRLLPDARGVAMRTPLTAAPLPHLPPASCSPRAPPAL